MKQAIKRFLLISSGVSVIALTSWIGLLLQKRQQLIGGGINPVFFFLLINAHLICMVLLLYLITHHSIKLFMERRRGAPGSVFKRNLVFAFMFLAVMPALFTLVIAWSFIRTSIDRWFAVRFDTMMVSTQALHDYHVRDVRQQVQNVGAELAVRYGVGTSQHKLQEYAQAHRCSFYLVPEAQAASVIAPWLQTEQVVWRSYREHNDRSMQSLRERFVQLVTKQLAAGYGSFDFFGSHYWGQRIGDQLMLLAYRYPAPMRQQLITLENAYADYQQLRKMRQAIHVAYLCTFILLALLILFLALWCAFYLARGISRPIADLLQATQRLGKGDWQVQVPTTPSSDLYALVQAFNQMAHELELTKAKLEQAQKRKTWQEAAQQMAHEIKNPLTPIQLATQRLQRRFKHEMAHDQVFIDCTTTILDQVATIKQLVAHFAQFAALPGIKLSVVDLAVLVADALTLYRLSYPAVSFKLVYDGPVWLTTDPAQLKLVLVNLLDNSVRALERAGCLQPEVVVSPLVTGQAVTLRFADNGPGIAPEVRDTLFLPHVSTDKKNMGLGLAIVYQIITQLGGEIFLLNTSSGTLFELVLPIGFRQK